jgi:hypothetical protein
MFKRSCGLWLVTVHMLWQKKLPTQNETPYELHVLHGSITSQELSLVLRLCAWRVHFNMHNKVAPFSLLIRMSSDDVVGCPPSRSSIHKSVQCVGACALA